MKQSSDSYKRMYIIDFLKNSKYNWRKLLLLSSVKLISKLHITSKTN